MIDLLALKNRERRLKAKKRLEEKLKSGVKNNNKKYWEPSNLIPLTNEDIARIKKEIAVLSSRI